MQGRCTSIRALAGMAGLAAVVGMTGVANAQSTGEPINRVTITDTKSNQNPLIFHSAREAIESGLIEPVENPEAFAGAQRGSGPNACVMEANCVQPEDGITGFNANFLSLAESRTFTQTGNLTEICASFIFTNAVAGGCPSTSDDPIFQSNWQVRIYEVQANGEILESTVQVFDTEAPSSNLIANSANGGLFGGFAPVVDMQFDLTAGGSGSGYAVNSGDCRAIQLRPLQFGTGDAITCNMFWASSSDPDDGSLTGDGQVASDRDSMNDWDFCEYTDRDLMLCLDVNSSPPTCSPDFSETPSNDECDSPTVIDCGPDGMASVEQCMRFATVNTMTDPILDDCENFGQTGFQGSTTTWYEVEATDTRLLVSLADTFGDPLDYVLALYREGTMPGEGEGPCNLVLVECENNFSTAVCLNDVTPGETFIIQVATIDSFGENTIKLDVICDSNEIPFPEPANDDVFDAEMINFDANGGAVISGSTRCSAPDPIASACGGTVTGVSPGVWYTFIGDGTTTQFSQCIGGGGGDYDSQINVYCGSPSLGLTCLAGNDDAATCAPQAEFSFCTEMGRQYFVYVHGFFDTGNFTFVVQQDSDGMGGCTNDPPQDDICITVEIDCNDIFPGGPDINEATDAAAMMEACEDDDVNNGCLQSTEMDPAGVFIEAGAAPFTACGTISTGNNLRDLDAYAFSLDARSVVTFEMIAEFDSAMFLASGVDCSAPDGGDFGDLQVGLAASAALAGTSNIITATLNAGDYDITVTANNFSGIPCGTTNNYTLEVTVEPIGRCCIAGKTMGTFDDCVVTSESECADLGGEFTDDADCSPVDYAKSTQGVQSLFGSIIGLPNNVIIDGGDDDGVFDDEDAQFVTIRGDDSDLFDTMGNQASMDFNFYGELKDTIGVASNGYLAFEQGGVIFIDFSPDPIPTASPDGPLNDFIAALWRDFDPSQGGANVEMGIFGSAPFRAVVVEFNGVPLFNQTGTSNTFQIQLFEGSNAIRVIYNDIEDPVFQDMDGDRVTVIGVENARGDGGTALDESELTAINTAGLASDEGVVWDFTPSQELTPDEACTAAPMVCLGDCNGDGVVNFGDLTSILFAFGNPGGSPAGCDANDDGAINFGDLTAALFAFGPCP